MADSYKNEFDDIQDGLSKSIAKIQKDASKSIEELNKKTKSYISSWDELGKAILKNLSPIHNLEKQIEELEIRKAARLNKALTYETKLLEVQKIRKSINRDNERLVELQKKSVELGNRLTDTEKKELKLLDAEVADRFKSDKLLEVEEHKLERQITIQQNKTKEIEKQIDLQKQNLAVHKFIKDVFLQMYKLSSDYDLFLSEQAKLLGRSKEIIDEQYKAIQSVNTETDQNLATNREIVAAQTKLVTQYTLSAKQSASIAVSVAQTAKSTGLTVDESVKLNSTLAEIGGTSLEAQKNMAGFAIQVAKAYGVPLNVLLKDVLNASNSVRVVFRGNTEELIKQAAEARKLGSTLDSAAKSAESLLSFESSITAEMKASALIGQGLNFNESRRLAFAGNLIEAEKALQKEIEKVGDLDKLNYNQRKALEQATGKTYEELQKIQTQKKNQLEIERRFPEEAKKLRHEQQKLAELQRQSKQNRDAEYKKMLDAQIVEANSAQISAAKAAALDRIGQVLLPIYNLATKIQIMFYKWVSGLNEGAIWGGLMIASLVGIGGTVALIIGKLKLLSLLLGGILKGLGSGLGLGLKVISDGIKALGGALQTFPVRKLIGLAAAITISSVAAIGFAKAFQMMKDVTVANATILVASLGLVVAGLIAAAKPFDAVAVEAFGLVLLLNLASLAVLGFGYAIKLATPAIEALCATISTVATAVRDVFTKPFETMLGVFGMLPVVVNSVTNSLTKLANVGFLKLAGAAAGVTAISSAIFGLGKNLSNFPADQLASITAQIDMLSNSAQGLQTAVDSLKELSDIKLPTIDLGDIATFATLNNNGKKEEVAEIKAGMKVLADKLDSLIGMMANGGISVNLDGMRVNHALDTSRVKRGSFGQATIQ